MKTQGGIHDRTISATTGRIKSGRNPSGQRLPRAGTSHAPFAQVRWRAIHRYVARIGRIAPGTRLNAQSGHAHQMRRAISTTAAAPPNAVPSRNSSRISASS
jgi:hypothetical protein